jgi:hypothetical protein
MTGAGMVVVGLVFWSLAALSGDGRGALIVPVWVPVFALTSAIGMSGARRLGEGVVTPEAHVEPAAISALRAAAAVAIVTAMMIVAVVTSTDGGGSARWWALGAGIVLGAGIGQLIAAARVGRWEREHHTTVLAVARGGLIIGADRYILIPS